MSSRESTERELRDELREAWRQVADLRWQLQSEQQNGRRQDRLLASEKAVLADVREEHRRTLADRDHEMADLEDEHGDLAYTWETSRLLTDGGSGLRVLHDLLHGSAQHCETDDERAVVLTWKRRAGVALLCQEELNRTGAGEASLDSAVRQVAHAAGADGPVCTIHTELRDFGVTGYQVILCGLLIDGWLAWVSEITSDARRGNASIRIHADGQRAEFHVELIYRHAAGEIAAPVIPTRSAITSIATTPGARIECASGSVNITVTFSAASEA